MSPVASHPSLSRTSAVASRQVVVPEHHARTTDEDLPVVGDSELGAHEGRAGGAERRILERAGATAALVSVSPYPFSTFRPAAWNQRRPRVGQARAARDEEADPPAQPGPDLGEHQPVGHHVLDPQQRARPAVLKPGR